MTSTGAGTRSHATPGRGGLAAPPACELRWRRVFPGRPEQLGQLRRWLGGLLPTTPACDDVVMVAVELATNAVAHTASGQGGWFTIEVSWHGPVVRVTVADQGAPAGPRVTGDSDGEHGRGLRVVRGLSARTGVSGDERGRLVWAEVPWPSDDAAGQRSSPGANAPAICPGGASLSQRWTGGLSRRSTPAGSWVSGPGVAAGRAAGCPPGDASAGGSG